MLFRSHGLPWQVHELPEPLSSEFRIAREEINYGVPMGEALHNMAARIPLTDLRYLIIAVLIQRESGGNLAEALHNLSTVLRARRMMGEKIKAMSSEALASAGIIGSLPPVVMLLVTLTAPAYMMLMFTDMRGQAMLLAGVTWMGMGVFVMKKMIAFKF